MEKINFKELEDLVNSHESCLEILSNIGRKSFKEVAVKQAFSKLNKHSMWLSISNYDIEHYLVPMLEARVERAERIFKERGIKI